MKSGKAKNNERIGTVNALKIYMVTAVIIVAFFGTLFTYLRYERVRSNGVYTQAEITAITSVKYDDRGYPMKDGVAVYDDLDGIKHTYRGYVGRNVEAGDMIPILYNRENPDEVVRNTGSSVWLAGLICLGILCVPLICASIKVFRLRKPDPEPTMKFI